MSKYRCPICGAPHKDEAEKCRLCGQSMAANAIPYGEVKVAQPLTTSRGLKGAIGIGVGIVAAILLGAVLFGIARPPGIERAANLVTGSEDGWTRRDDRAGGYSIELPGEPIRSRVTSPVTDEGALEAWTVSVGTDTDLTVGYGRVAPPPAAPGPAGVPVDSAATAWRYLRDSIVPRWLAANGVDAVFVDQADGVVGGFPAVLVRSQQSRFTLDGQPAFGHAAFVLRDRALYVLQVVSIYRDAPQLDRLINTFTPTGPAA